MIGITGANFREVFLSLHSLGELFESFIGYCPCSFSSSFVTVVVVIAQGMITTDGSLKEGTGTKAATQFFGTPSCTSMITPTRF